MQLHKHIIVKQRIPNVVISRSGESLFGAQQPNNTVSSLLIMQATCLKCSTVKFVCNTQYRVLRAQFRCLINMKHILVNMAANGRNAD